MFTILASHWLACCWGYAGNLIGSRRNSWMGPFLDNDEEMSALEAMRAYDDAARLAGYCVNECAKVGDLLDSHAYQAVGVATPAIEPRPRQRASERTESSPRRFESSRSAVSRRREPRGIDVPRQSTPASPIRLKLRERKRGRSARQSAGERPVSLERARARTRGRGT